MKKASIEAKPLPPEEALKTWDLLADRIQAKTSIDVRRSEAYFLWEALYERAEEVGGDFQVPMSTSEWVLLFEEIPEAAYVTQARPIRMSDFPSPFWDLYIAPWPRLNSLVMLTHEQQFGPYHLPLKTQ